MLLLALDGGGIRGAFSARILQRLELAHPGFLASVDLFAGTSTGGLLALGLASGMTPAQMVDLYIETAARIFPTDPVRAVESLDGLNLPKHDNAGLMAVLREKFGELRLPELEREVLIATYMCVPRGPVDLTREDEVSVVDAALRTSAAPYYLPPYEDCIDGGVTGANNPALSAILWALERNNPIASIWVLSIGTGNAKLPGFSPGVGWGGIDWLKHGLIDLFIEAPAQRATQDCVRLLDTRFCRVDGVVDCPMDANDGLEERLIAPADALDLTGALKFIEAATAVHRAGLGK